MPYGVIDDVINSSGLAASSRFFTRGRSMDGILYDTTTVWHRFYSATGLARCSVPTLSLHYLDGISTYT